MTRGAGAPVLRGGLAAASLASFVVLGLPEGMLGVAWPVLRHQFGQPLAGLGELMLASLATYLLVTVTAGWLQRRWGAGGNAAPKSPAGRDWWIAEVAEVVTVRCARGLKRAYTAGSRLGARRERLAEG